MLKAHRTYALAHLYDLFQFLGHDVRVAVHLYHAKRLDVRQSGVDHLVDGLDARRVHDLHCRWEQGLGDEGRHALPGLFKGIETGQDHGRLLGLGDDPQCDLHDDAQGSLAAHEQPFQLVARSVL